MTTIPILRAEQHWECPSCDETKVTHLAAGDASYPLHACRGQVLLTLPMVPAGTRSVHVVRELEDYIGTKLVTRSAEGRPVTHVDSIRDDGMDATVYPVTAVATREEWESYRA